MRVNSNSRGQSAIKKKSKLKFDVRLIIFNPTFKTFKVTAWEILNMPV
jgi:hypothetical protein